MKFPLGIAVAARTGRHFLEMMVDKAVLPTSNLVDDLHPSV